MDAEVGWIAAIIIGGIAGWLAEQFMKSDMGLLMNIVLGIVGAAIASAILSAFGIVLGGWLGYLEHFSLMLTRSLRVGGNWRILSDKLCVEANESCARGPVSFAQPLFAAVL